MIRPSSPAQRLCQWIRPYYNVSPFTYTTTIKHGNSPSHPVCVKVHHPQC